MMIDNVIRPRTRSTGPLSSGYGTQTQGMMKNSIVGLRQRATLDRGTMDLAAAYGQTAPLVTAKTARVDDWHGDSAGYSRRLIAGLLFLIAGFAFEGLILALYFVVR